MSDAWVHFTRCEGELSAAYNSYGKTYACHPVRNERTNMNNHLKVCENYLATKMFLSRDVNVNAEENES